jgi:hypothetical protein
VAVWLVAAAALVVAVRARPDRVVEAEAPQVVRRGGSPVPPEGTFSSYTHRNGWRLGNGNGITVPLHVRGSEPVRLVGWLEGPACDGAVLVVRWGESPASELAIRGGELSGVLLPAAPEGGRHRLHVDLSAPEPGELVVDRLEVVR